MTCKLCEKEVLSTNKNTIYRKFCRDHYNEYYRKYRKDNSQRTREIHRVSRMKRYYEDPRERIRTSANKKVFRALASGLLKRELCYCGNIAEAHHDSYAEKDWLKVRWLCVACHASWHRENEPTY